MGETERNMSSSKWRPDWRDAAAYDLSGASPTQIGWEFLRRNEEYQRDFAALDDLFDRTAVSRVPRPATYDEAVARLYVFQEKYRLNDGVFPPRPADDDTPDLCFKASLGPTYVEYRESIEQSGREQDVLSPSRPWELVLRIDLRVPVGAQVEKLTALLRAKAADYAQQERHHRGKLSAYLRLLDAELANASVEEMAATIYPDKNNEYPDYLGSRAVKNGLRAAHRYCESGYYSLQFMPLEAEK